MALTLYGISNCDTVRKARRWLEDAGLEYRFHDFRKDGLKAGVVAGWLAQREWDEVVNKRSSSWKALSVEERDSMDAASAASAIGNTPTLVKRPVLEDSALLEFGFSAARYQQLLGDR